MTDERAAFQRPLEAKSGQIISASFQLLQARLLLFVEVVIFKQFSLFVFVASSMDAFTRKDCHLALMKVKYENFCFR